MNAVPAIADERQLTRGRPPRMRPRLLLPPPPAHWALFVAIDGCVLDLEAAPERTRVPAALLLALGELRIALGGALALVSGRTLEQIARLFAPQRFCAAGQH